MAHITIDLNEARASMAEAVALANDPGAETNQSVELWTQKVRHFSATCEAVKYRTGIAVLGNAMLAKSTNQSVDVFSLKASADDPGAYDARRTAENVLVPAAQANGFHLGVTGPQPLNNFTFLRHHRINMQMTVRKNARPLLEELIQLLHAIRNMSRLQAIEALAAFIIVRRTFVAKYPAPPQAFSVATTAELAAAVQKLVGVVSEHGGRAMACAAGILDASFGAARVHLGKINDPDRRVPGDIGILSSVPNSTTYERVLEIRDKAVFAHTVLPPVGKAVRAGIRKVTVVAVSKDQDALDIVTCRKDAREAGADLAVFLSWDPFIQSLSEWASSSELAWVESAVVGIRARLEEIGLPTTTVVAWDQLTAKSTTPV